MSDFKVVLNWDGVGALLKSNDILKACTDVAKAKSAAENGSYIKTRIGASRCCVEYYKPYKKGKKK